MVSLVIGEIMHTSKHDERSWTDAGAKAKLSEVMERAQSAPQTITRNGRPSVVVVSTEEWQKKTARKGSLAEFLLASPLRGADLNIERQGDDPRELCFAHGPATKAAATFISVFRRRTRQQGERSRSRRSAHERHAVLAKIAELMATGFAYRFNASCFSPGMLQMLSTLATRRSFD